MSNDQGKTSRRAFFLNGGAVLGAGLAATGTALAAAPVAASAGDAAIRETIRALHARFLRHLSSGEIAAAAALFAPDARLELGAPVVRGARAIRRLLEANATTAPASDDTAARHGAYRVPGAAADDAITVHADGAAASATFGAEAELCVPLAATCTVAQMARLQGNVESRHWQPGRFDVRYAKLPDGWKIADLRWSAT